MRPPAWAASSAGSCGRLPPCGQRDQAPVGDLGAVRNLADHYEELGVPVLRLLAQEDRSPALRALADQGRAYQRAGASGCSGQPGRAGRHPARRRLAQLIAVTDVLTWKLLRHDRHLSRRQTELALIELLQPLTGGGRWPGSSPTPRPGVGTCTP